MQKPIGVAMYWLSSELPEDFQWSLPTVEQLEMELNTAIATQASEGIATRASEGIATQASAISKLAE